MNYSVATFRRLLQLSRPITRTSATRRWWTAWPSPGYAAFTRKGDIPHRSAERNYTNNGNFTFSLLARKHNDFPQPISGLLQTAGAQHSGATAGRVLFGRTAVRRNRRYAAPHQRHTSLDLSRTYYFNFRNQRLEPAIRHSGDAVMRRDFSPYFSRALYAGRRCADCGDRADCSITKRAIWFYEGDGFHVSPACQSGRHAGCAQIRARYVRCFGRGDEDRGLERKTAGAKAILWQCTSYAIALSPPAPNPELRRAAVSIAVRARAAANWSGSASPCKYRRRPARPTRLHDVAIRADGIRKHIAWIASTRCTTARF